MEPPTTGGLFNYVVTAHKPTAVTHSLVGHFTSPTDINLIINKCTRVEIHTITADGLRGVADLPIYGRVSNIELFRPKGESKDLLFLLTERYKVCILEYDATTGEVVTRAHGDVQDKIGRPSDAGQLAIIDPECRMIGLHMYDGMFKVIPVDDKGTLNEAVNLRLEELHAVDIAFLACCARPTIAMIYEDGKNQRHAKTYEVSLKDKELVEGPWAQSNLDAGASHVIAVPAPLGGALVVGENVIAYLNDKNTMKAVAMQSTVIQAYSRIDDDGTRYLLGDMHGGLHLLVLAHDGHQVAGLKLQPLGTTSIATSLTYLDSGMVYVGSMCDQQLVRLHTAPLPGSDPHSYVEVVDTFASLAPIVDFAVMDLERQGQGQVVTCSGIQKDGSLRVVRAGVGIQEQATVELPGIKGVWSLRESWAVQHDTYLVLSFVGDTRVLAINVADELDEAELPGFDADEQTLHAANTRYDMLAQVTRREVRLVACGGGQLAAQWAFPGGASVSLAASSPTQVLVSSGGGRITCLEVGAGVLSDTASTTLDAEVACLDCSPLGMDADAAEFCAVGTWERRVLLLRMSDLSPLLVQDLGGDVIPRSLLLVNLEACAYLLCGLGDGQLVNWRVGDGGGALRDRKQLCLGSKHVLLRPFRQRGAAMVFAASDRPTIIYSNNRKLLYSNLNENEVNFVASFNSASFEDSLAIAKEGSLTIGGVDEIQKLHVRAVPLGVQPRRIAHQESTRTLAVGTVHSNNPDALSSSVLILDDSTFDVRASLSLEPHELLCSLAAVSLRGETALHHLFAVGTGVVHPDESEPSKGRIVLLSYSDGQLQVVHEREVKGCVYCVLGFQGGLLAGVNSRVALFSWAARPDGAHELVQECSHQGRVLALYMAARGDFVLVGDLQRSVSLLLFKSEERSLELRARDYNATWCTAVEVLDDDTYVAGENSYNIFVTKKNSDAATDDERSRLEVVGYYHVGEFVNVFRHGSLVMRLPDSELAGVPTLLFGGTGGSLGLIAALPEPLFRLLEKAQAAMRQVVKGVGGLDHESWRAFVNERTAHEAAGFVDGDLLEQFLDLPHDKASEVVKLMGGGVTVDELTRRLEELSRLH